MLFFSLFFFGYTAYSQNDFGGSSLGVGGAPVGLNNSVECGLYNPAGFIGVEKLNVFAGFNVTKGEAQYPHISEPMDIANLNYIFPDYLGIVFPFRKDFFFGFSLSMPYRLSRTSPLFFTAVDTSPQGYQEIPGDYTESEKFYFLNPSVGKVINDRFSVGLNMGMFWKNSRSVDDFDDSTGYEDISLSMDKYGVEPCLGLQYKASDILSLGFIIKKGFGKAYRETFYGVASSIESDESLPLVVGFGTGINLKDRVYINLSAEYLQWTLAYSEGYVESDEYRNVVRVHLGGQYRINDLLSLSAGFYNEPYQMKLSPLAYHSDSYDQIFLSGGVGLDFGRVALNLGAASSALIKKDPSFREENHLNVSLVYR